MIHVANVAKVLVAGATLAVGSTALAAVGAALLEPVMVAGGIVSGVVALFAIRAGFSLAKSAAAKKQVAAKRPSSSPPVVMA
jgi:hypothetical protein